MAGRIILALITVLAYWSAFRYLYRAREVRQQYVREVGPVSDLPRPLRASLRPGCFYPLSRFNGYSLLILGTIALVLLVKTLVTP